ncbi:Bacteriophage protein [Mycobacteroides abscessus subsp. abscessus]|nr:Bacteriophage protein [Mycobacteroides abscessus subsp. abscessus]SHY41879.1 Bacteriophage protein [Mycobacteroides abscessus subsp. abscessus]SIC44305.1 Bacteriophage protein [Mycobacteroides abscessus subsp. abscessus]SIE67017.1 Bacteriophage protein [Mycobacteroides abscessus subsp. abscessus]SIG40166.1 Bacteriophage protein [Mycobacteroides abscessus subsp. abscessus]
MAVYSGSLGLQGVYLGSTPVQKIYLGTTEIWSGASPVQFVGANANANNNVTIPAHLVGDLIVLCGYNPYATTAPTKPSAAGTVPNWDYIDNANSAGGSGIATACFTATATNTTSGTWSNAGHMIAVVLRAHNPADPIGGHASQGGSSSGPSPAPAITLDHTDGSSVVLEFHGHSNLSSTGWDSAPAGYTRRAASGSAFGPGLVLNTKDSSTSDGSVSQTGGQNFSNYAGAAVEIRN